MRCKVDPYEGPEPYVFVSYAHRDGERVFPIIERLAADGFRIWFDEGIDPGSEWIRNIGEHLGAASAAITFLSANSVESQNCREEIMFARSAKIPLLTIHLEDVEIDQGLQLALMSYQAVFRHAYDDEEEFYRKLERASMLTVCRADVGEEPEETTEASGVEKGPEEAPMASGFEEEPRGVVVAPDAGAGPTKTAVTPGGTVPLGQTTAGQMPYDRMPSGQAPFVQPTANQSPYGQISSGQVPFGQMPTSQAPSAQMPVKQAPYNYMFASQSPHNHVSASQTPSNHAPTNQTPYDQAPYGQTPSAYGAQQSLQPAKKKSGLLPVIVAAVAIAALVGVGFAMGLFGGVSGGGSSGGKSLGGGGGEDADPVYVMTRRVSYDTSGKAWLEVTYERDDEGNVEKSIRKQYGEPETTITETHTFDDYGNLTKLTSTSGSGASSSTIEIQYENELDKSNRVTGYTSEGDNPPQHGTLECDYHGNGVMRSSHAETAAEGSDDKRIDDFEFDERGFRVRYSAKTYKGNTLVDELVREYEWEFNSKGNPSSVTIAEDWNGKKSTVTYEITCDDAGNAIELVDKNGNTIAVYEYAKVDDASVYVRSNPSVQEIG